jgi:hypothetical protein
VLLTRRSDTIPPHTNQARRGWGKRPDPPRARDGPGHATCTLSPAQSTYRINDRPLAWFQVSPNSLSRRHIGEWS